MSELATRIEAAAAPWPRFRDLPEPKMVALYAANGSGTKVYQGFLDGHPELYMVPAYPLMYLYPHWYEWRDSLKDWSWASDRKSTRLNSSHIQKSRMPSSA